MIQKDKERLEQESDIKLSQQRKESQRVLEEMQVKMS